MVCKADEIRVGDTLTITFILPQASTDAGDKDFPVRDDGTINMPKIGVVKVAGKRFSELETELQGRYVPDYYSRLTVVIKPRERTFTVGGEVRNPGRVLYTGETTVLRAITSCGDFNEFANRRKVEIIRANGDREVVDCKKARENPLKYDRTVCPGDALYVPRSL